MAHLLISRLLVVALLFQALAVVPAALAYCPGGHAEAAAPAHDCAGNGDTSRHICPGCLAGLPLGACASACAALAIPVDPAPPVAGPDHVSIVPLAAVPVHGQRDAPPDPPPIV